MKIHITDEMIEKRRLENQRIYKQKWRDKNKERVNQYARMWHRKYREEHGVSYRIDRERIKAREQLLREKSAIDPNCIPLSGRE